MRAISLVGRDYVESNKPDVWGIMYKPDGQKSPHPCCVCTMFLPITMVFLN